MEVYGLAYGFAYALFAVQIILISDTRADECPNVCKCDDGYVSCRNHGHKLTYIPKLDYVRELQFFGNYLPHVTQKTFANISTRDLTLLSMNNDSITTIASDSFDLFHRLERLYLGENIISVKSFEALFASVSRLDSLETLGLHSLSIPMIPDNFFANIAGTQINVLKLRHNNMTSVPSSVFTCFSALAVLDLKYNAIEAFEIKEVMRDLELLSLGHNRIASFPKCCSSNGSALVPAIRRIYFRFNQLTSVSKDMFHCLIELKELDLAGNDFRVLQNDMLLYLVSLRSLTIDYIRYTALRVQPYAFRSQSLEHLSFKTYMLARYLFESFDKTFNNTPKLIFLNLQSTSFAKVGIRDIEIILQPLINLQYLSLYNGRRTTISDELFDNKHKLKLIDLGRNKLSSLNAPFKSLTHLKTLKLNHNMISEISSDMLPFNQHSLKRLDLSYNPFICNCEITWFKHWLASTRVHIKQYPEHYTCAGPDTVKGKKIKDLTFTYRQCHPFKPYEWAAMIGGPSLVVIVAIATIIYRNRWNIKHYIYLVRKRRNYERVENIEFDYDAFVGYSQQDYEWVRGTLLPKLEVENNYKLCVHDRDFTPGKYILDNIITHLDKSRQIILVVSNDFAKSEWCRFELRLAQQRSIEDDNAAVIVVLLEDLQARNVPKLMKLLMNTTTYIEWTNDRVGQELFWTKLTDVLRRPV